MLNFFRLSVLLFVLVLAFICGGAVGEVYAAGTAVSKIKTKYHNHIFKKMRLLLPKEGRKCDLRVEKVAPLTRRSGYPGFAEEWTVNVCQERREYFIIDQSIFYGGILAPLELLLEAQRYTVEPKEERIAREKKLWDAVKNDDKGGEWRATLFYVDEIEGRERK